MARTRQKVYGLDGPQPGPDLVSVVCYGLVVAAAATLIVSPFLPWVSGGVSISGFTNKGDEVILLPVFGAVSTAIAVISLALRDDAGAARGALYLLGCAALALSLFYYLPLHEAITANSQEGQESSVFVGPGLYLSIAGSGVQLAAVLGATMVDDLRRRSQRSLGRPQSLPHSGAR